MLMESITKFAFGSLLVENPPTAHKEKEQKTEARALSRTRDLLLVLTPLPKFYALVKEKRRKQ